MDNQRTAAEQELIDQREKAFYARTIGTHQPGRFIRLWVGPRDRKEIGLALAGQPTIVDCSIGPNINDGSMDGSFYRNKKGWKTIAEYEQWLANAKPKDLVYPCPFCATGKYTATSADDLATHISNEHKTTPDFDNKHNPENMGVPMDGSEKTPGESKLDALLGPKVETKKKAK